MKMFLRRIILIFLVFHCCFHLFAQNISGTWEGVMPGSGGTFLQMNIQQQGFQLCGFTYDYVMYNKQSYCKAKFEGRFDNKKNLGLLIGTGFIENSGSHILMRMKIWRQAGDNSNTFHAAWIQDDLITSFLTGSADADSFIMKRVSLVPNKLPRGVPACFPKQPQQSKVTTGPTTKPVKNNTTTEKPPVSKPIVKPPVKPVIRQEKNVTQPPVVKTPVKKDPPVNDVPKVFVVPKETNGVLLKEMNSRRKSEQSRIVINTNHINLKLYDNGTVDNDSVSVFYNGRLIVSHQRLSEKAIELNIDLDEGKEIHEITMYAENLGSIPPNTALVVVTAGSKRYELRSKASLEENAVLIFEYKKE